MTPEERIVACLKSIPEVERIHLFGSRARGDAAPRADLDIAVTCPTASRKQWLRIWDLVEHADTLLFVDLVRLEAASAELKARILREGKIIYERS